ncbi:MAG: DNA repair protein RecN, partial [Flavobacteriales bacterium]|nr:DNA repair protein RecN [Flavobacteriales bacterium]
MIKSLSIQNYVLIEKLDLEFDRGLSIITGETGAGKSILVGALSLLLGDRADTNVLQDRETKCIIEGVFDISKYNLSFLFTQHDLDFESTTIIRREISPNGKSRAFINDTPVKLTVLREFGTELVDIHSQHEKLLLYNPGFHLSVVDAYAQHEDALKDYRSEFRQYRLEQKNLAQLIEREKTSRADYDYLQFQVKELEEVDLQGQNVESLEEEASQLSHAEEIKHGLQKAAEELSNEEGGVTAVISNTLVNLLRVSDYLKSVGELEGRLKSLSVEMDDIVYEMERIQENTAYDPERLETVNDVLNKVNHLLFKHGANTVEDLIDLKESLSSKLSDTDSLEDDIADAKKSIDKLHAGLTAKALRISKQRKTVFEKIETEIKLLIRGMGMDDAEIQVHHAATSELGQYGVDEIEIKLRANKGGVFAELSKAASGGELSRVMLAIKSSMSKLKSHPTMIFDEIDSGVSGEVADKMGALMKKIATTLQVITITHLPQIASKANTHFLAFKLSDEKMAHSNIKRLKEEQRVEEIAKMLSGEELSNAALENAKEL